MKSAVYQSCSVACLLFLSSTSFTQQQVEVFHLKRGVHVVYDYSDRSHSWNWGSYSSRIDSGSIAYTVRDSLVSNDTTVVWSVSERRDIIRKVSNSQIDTAYWVRDSTEFNLYESTIGRHELRGTSLLWQFPFAIDQTPLIRVFRYADSLGTVSFTRQAGGCMMLVPSNFDSLLLSPDSSLIARSFSFCDDHDEWGSYMWRRGKLRSLIVLGVDTNAPLPDRVLLFQNYPNPFNPSTEIRYQIPEVGRVTLKVFDLLGREVATLVDEVQGSGSKEVEFNANALSSGMYFYRLTAGTFAQTKKAILLK